MNISLELIQTATTDRDLAVIHPVYYRHIVKDAPDKFRRFAKEVFRPDTAEAGVEALAEFHQRVRTSYKTESV